MKARPLIRLTTPTHSHRGRPCVLISSSGDSYTSWAKDCLIRYVDGLRERVLTYEFELEEYDPDA